jgi:anaerobic ribonucleoside-triphosphate reductase
MKPIIYRFCLILIALSFNFTSSVAQEALREYLMQISTVIDSSNNKAVFSWENESKKPLLKLNAMYLLWLSAMKKHGIKRANKIIEYEIKGALRIHDFHIWLKPYCWASSLNKLVSQGMPFYTNKHIGPIKHFDSFINLSLQYICYISNQIAGAVALPDFFFYADYFIRKDYGEEWAEKPDIVRWIKQQFQSWICSVNLGLGQ